jgi:hypothetical protein
MPQSLGSAPGKIGSANGHGSGEKKQSFGNGIQVINSDSEFTYDNFVTIDAC